MVSLEEAQSHVVVGENLVAGCIGVMHDRKTFNKSVTFLSSDNRSRLWNEWFYYRAFMNRYIIYQFFATSDDKSGILDTFDETLARFMQSNFSSVTGWENLNGYTLLQRASYYWDKAEEREDYSKYLTEFAQYDLFQQADLQVDVDYTKSDYIDFKFSYFMPNAAALYNYIYDILNDVMKGRIFKPETKKGCLASALLLPVTVPVEILRYVKGNFL